DLPAPLIRTPPVSAAFWKCKLPCGASRPYVPAPNWIVSSVAASPWTQSVPDALKSAANTASRSEQRSSPGVVSSAVVLTGIVAAVAGDASTNAASPPASAEIHRRDPCRNDPQPSSTAAVSPRRLLGSGAFEERLSRGGAPSCDGRAPRRGSTPRRPSP